MENFSPLLCHAIMHQSRNYHLDWDWPVKILINIHEIRYSCVVGCNCLQRLYSCAIYFNLSLAHPIITMNVDVACKIYCVNFHILTSHGTDTLIVKSIDSLFFNLIFESNERQILKDVYQRQSSSHHHHYLLFQCIFLNT